MSASAPGNTPTAIMAIISAAMGMYCIGDASVRSANRSLSGPNMTRWSVHRIYPAARTTPNADMEVAIGKSANAPRKTIISATNPPVPGNPSAASPATTRDADRTGIRRAKPPRSGM